MSAAFEQEHVKREKLVMAECDCPFMVNLVASFKDNAHLYMLQEAIMGGELFTYLQVTRFSNSSSVLACSLLTAAALNLF